MKRTKSQKADEEFLRWWINAVGFGTTNPRYDIYNKLFRLGARTKDLDYAEKLRDIVRQWDQLKRWRASVRVQVKYSAMPFCVTCRRAIEGETALSINEYAEKRGLTAERLRKGHSYDYGGNLFVYAVSSRLRHPCGLQYGLCGKLLALARNRVPAATSAEARNAKSRASKFRRIFSTWIPALDKQYAKQWTEAMTEGPPIVRRPDLVGDRIAHTLYAKHHAEPCALCFEHSVQMVEFEMLLDSADPDAKLIPNLAQAMTATFPLKGVLDKIPQKNNRGKRQ